MNRSEDVCISIVIPVGPGHEKLVRRAQKSVARQVPVPGFTIETVRQPDPAGKGAGWARNWGVKEARGELLVFLDADDQLAPTFVRETLQVFAESGRYVYTDCLMDLDGTVKEWPSPDFHPRRFLEPHFQHAVTTLLPRVMFEDVGGFDERLPAWEDPDLYARLILRGWCGARCPQPLLMYHALDGYRRERGLKRRTELRRHFARYETRERMACCGKKRTVAAGKKRVKAAASGGGNPARQEPPDDFIKAEFLKRGAVAPVGKITGVRYPRMRARDDSPTIFMAHKDDVAAELKRPGGPWYVALKAPNRDIAAKVEALRAMVEAKLAEAEAAGDGA